MPYATDPLPPIRAAGPARKMRTSFEELVDIESLDDADCDRLDDLTVHFGRQGWSEEGDEAF